MRSVFELFKLDRRVAIVTGGAGLLGSQICDSLAEAGAHVVVASRNLERCQAKADEIRKLGHPAPMAISLDVTKGESVESMVNRVMAEFGRIDILVNNAYSATSNSFEDMKVEEFDSALRGTLTSSFLCAQTVSRPMTKAKYGVIINVASIYGIVSPDHRIYGDTGNNSPCNYGPAKAGVIQLTRWLATHLAPRGIRVNSISPGGIHNPANLDLPGYEAVFVKNYCNRTPLGRLGNETDFKGAFLYLASEASAYVTGHNLIVDGGLTAW
jgi:NAD(P)-dependent dehydrogenase (short-subunit alcohol dehydrogenase family)